MRKVRARKWRGAHAGPSLRKAACFSPVCVLLLMADGTLFGHAL